MKGIIKAVETPEGKYMIGYNDDLYNVLVEKIPLEDIGSYNVLPARILGISYAEFLRYARDKYHGTIYGRAHKYPFVVFNSEEECNLLCKELLLRWCRI